MNEVTVVRWRRYGKDRLYVTAPNGTKLGWHDLQTGEDHPEAPGLADHLASAIADCKPEGQAISADGATPAADQETPASPIISPTSPPVRGPAAAATAVLEFAADVSPVPAEPAEPSWEDLAGRRPGAAAREQAIGLRHAAPVRTVLARALRVHTDERAWRLGADGEQLVAGQLAKLARKDPGWRFLHAIPVGENGADIDHLVVGPGGVFTLNAKNHPGAKIWVAGNTFMVNGRRQPYLRNSRFEAGRAGKLLTSAAGFEVQAVGVVVPVNAPDLKVKTPPDGAHVVNRMRLVAWLRAWPAVLDERTITAIADAARRSTTWRKAT